MTRRERPKRKGGLSKPLGSGAPDERPKKALYSQAEEEARAQALSALDLLDTEPEERFDRICRLAQDIMQAPATYISLLDRDRQWFKSTCGMGELKETPREGTFCDYAIRRSRPTIVLNATEDPLFSRSPYVVNEPKVRFYTGFPLMSQGQRVGTLCALDFEPRSEVSEQQMAQLSDLARMAEQELSLGSVSGPSPVGARRGQISTLVVEVCEAEQLFAKLEPELVVAIFNLYLEHVVTVVEHWGGNVDDISGGVLRASFGLSSQQLDDCLHAAACALDIQRTLPEVNQALSERQLPLIACGIGLHRGNLVVGDVGAQALWKPTWIGRDGFLAQQIATMAAPGQILASEQFLKGGRGLLVAESEPHSRLTRGQADSYLFRLLGLESAAPPEESL